MFANPVGWIYVFVNKLCEAIRLYLSITTPHTRTIHLSTRLEACISITGGFSPR